MSKKTYGTYSLATISIFMISFIVPVFGEVVDLQTNSQTYQKGDKITFTGEVQPNSSGLVTIVIRDNNDEFVLLTQAITDENYSFEKTIEITDKFRVSGNYHATGFILNMTAGVSTNFGIDFDYYPVVESPVVESPVVESPVVESPVVESPVVESPVVESPVVESPVVESPVVESPVVESPVVESPVVESPVVESPVEYNSKRVDFVDLNKNPQYYLDRYYNEPKYKSWFDRNYPDITIEEAIEYSYVVKDTKNTVEQFMNNEILPEAEASSIIEPKKQSNDNSDNAQMVLAIGGLGILFGAVYGIKKKVDDNSKQISLNKDIIRKKIINPLLGSNPYDILQTRLAKGEISLEEYDKLEQKLRKKSN